MPASVNETPPCLKRVVDEAKRNPYEAFASAAVSLAFHDDENCPYCARLSDEVNHVS